MYKSQPGLPASYIWWFVQGPAAHPRDTASVCLLLPLAAQLNLAVPVVALYRRYFRETELTEPPPDSASNPDSDYRVKR
ncbi:hypothetical protein, partial [Enterobacter hormaechei]|uniref:hypothetical protein n=1 Tax=Enterobacter hormaechei TaxID=158836 RepID=UPI001EED8B34